MGDKIEKNKLFLGCKKDINCQIKIMSQMATFMTAVKQSPSPGLKKVAEEEGKQPGSGTVSGTVSGTSSLKMSQLNSVQEQDKGNDEAAKREERIHRCIELAVRHDLEHRLATTSI